MKKIIIFALTFVLISVVFVVPVSAETENSNLYLSDLPVISTSSKLSGNLIYFYNLYQNYSDYSVNGLLTVLPLVKINGEWCYLSRNTSNNCQYIQFGFVDNKIRFYIKFFQMVLQLLLLTICLIQLFPVHLILNFLLSHI